MSAIEILVGLLKVFEGCRLDAYQDQAGVWTIGYGETLDIVEGMVWTQEQADSRLLARAQEFLNQVIDRCPELSYENPYRQAACASLAYNIGIEGFAGSTVCRQTTAMNYELAAAAFVLWDKVRINGVLTVSKDLIERRESESKTYMTVC